MAMPRLEPDDPPQIGKYRVLQRLGEGATSEVFLAYDDFNSREVAIKRVRASAGRSEADVHFSTHFFAAEAALVGRLNHPNVVQIHDAVDDGTSSEVRAWLVQAQLYGGLEQGEIVTAHVTRRLGYVRSIVSAAS